MDSETQKNTAVINIAEDGDVILNVTFENPGCPEDGRLFRVDLESLASRSRYFANLLKNASFREAKSIADRHAELRRNHIAPSEAPAAELPSIGIVDDEGSTDSSTRADAFQALFRVLHGTYIIWTKEERSPGIMCLSILLTLADRYDCLDVVAPSVRPELLGCSIPIRDRDQPITSHAEQFLRQKILLGWRAREGPWLASATREIVMAGSKRWAVDSESDVSESAEAPSRMAAWWDLPDGLEQELQFRRERILNMIASVPRHFIRLYSGSQMQCNRWYENSPACDGFHLGQMIKHLTSKNLMHLVDVGPSSARSVPNWSRLPVEVLLSALKQLPAYQIDKFHVNCGPKGRIRQILPFIETLLGSRSVSITAEYWVRGLCPQLSWQVPSEEGEKIVFRYSDSIDRRLASTGGESCAAEMAREVFTATEWDWTSDHPLCRVGLAAASKNEGRQREASSHRYPMRRL